MINVGCFLKKNKLQEKSIRTCGLNKTNFNENTKLYLNPWFPWRPWHANKVIGSPISLVGTSKQSIRLLNFKSDLKDISNCCDIGFFILQALSPILPAKSSMQRLDAMFRICPLAYGGIGSVG